MRLNVRQVCRLARLVDAAPWGDLENALVGVEIVLGLLMEATHTDFVLWELEAEPAGYPDEFAVSDADLAAMPDRLRHGYVARLIRNVALDFGVSTEYSGRIGVRRNYPDALAPLLRQLYEIVASSEDDERNAGEREP